MRRAENKCAAGSAARRNNHDTTMTLLVGWRSLYDEVVSEWLAAMAELKVMKDQRDGTANTR